MLTAVATAPVGSEGFALAPDGTVCFGGVVSLNETYYPGTDTITCDSPAGAGSPGTVRTETAAGPVMDLGFDAAGNLYYAANHTIYRYGATGSTNLIEEPAGSSAPPVVGTVTVTGTESVSPGLYAATLTRDRLGRIRAATETVLGWTSSYRYRYDRAGRLVGVTRNGVVIGAYRYNANGDRIADGTMTATYNADDELVEDGGTRFTYDAEGDLVQEETASGERTVFGYNGLGELVRVGLPDGTEIGYLYDGLGRRVGKTVDGKLVAGYLWAGRRLVGLLDGSGALEETFVWGTRGNVPEEMVTADGTEYRIVADVEGSVRLVVNAETGVVKQELRYSPWGRVTEDTDPGFQPFGYAGGLDDPETGLERFGVRDYDPATGRWIEPDPILFAGGGTNLYGYAANDPINFYDPYGLFYLPNIPQPVVNVAVGFGDGVYKGLTLGTENLGTVRRILGWGVGAANHCSSGYGFANAVGSGVGVSISGYLIWAGAAVAENRIVQIGVAKSVFLAFALVSAMSHNPSYEVAKATEAVNQGVTFVKQGDELAPVVKDFVEGGGE